METRAVLHVGTLSYELMDPMQIFPIALRGDECEEKLPPNDPNEQLCRDVPDPFSTARGGPGNQNRAEPKKAGTVARQAPGSPELVTSGDDIGNDAHGAVQSEGSGSQCRFSSRTLDRIDFS